MRRPNPEDFLEEGARRPTKKQKSKTVARSTLTGRPIELTELKPITENQAKAFDAWARGKHLLLHGCAGTGKTMLAMYLGLTEVDRDGDYDKIVLVRSAVPTRSQGFLPGSLKEKAAVYEMPFASVCSELYGRGDAYGVLKNKGMFEFITTSYIRGITLTNCVVIVDEMQNMTSGELSSVITRVGRGCRIIFMGDYFQGDLVRDAERQGLLDFMKVIDRMGSFEKIEFGLQDIVRSDLVKSFLTAQRELGVNLE